MNQTIFKRYFSLDEFLETENVLNDFSVIENYDLLALYRKLYAQYFPMLRNIPMQIEDSERLLLKAVYNLSNYKQTKDVFMLHEARFCVAQHTKESQDREFEEIMNSKY